MNQSNAKDLIKKALNLSVWQAKKGTGSFLTFDMGERVAIKRKDGTTFDRGSFHLWIYLCDWEISVNGNVLARSDAIDADIGKAVKSFDGQKISSIDQVNINTIEIKASDGLSITLFGNDKVYEQDDDFFILYTPNGNVSFSKALGFNAEPAENTAIT